MRKLFIAAALAGGLGAFCSSSGMSAPADGSSVLDAAGEVTSTAEEARLYCADRRSGRFLYWGRCQAYRRYYCVNRYTHRFLHWGRC